MARARLVSQDIASDPELNMLTPDAERLYLRTLPHLDRDGLITGDPMLLWAAVAPKRPELLDRAPALINEWVERNLVVRYQWKDGFALHFKGFRKHNANITYSHEQASKFPPPPGWTRSRNGLVPDDEESCFRLAESFDPRSSYRKELLSRVSEELLTSATQPAYEPEPTTSLGTNDVVATMSRHCRDEDQDQDQDQSDDDDDPIEISTTHPVIESDRARDHPAYAKSEPDRLIDWPGQGTAYPRAHVEAICHDSIAQLFGDHFHDSYSYVQTLDDIRIFRLLEWLYVFERDYERIDDWAKNPVGLLKSYVGKLKRPGNYGAGLPTRDIQTITHHLRSAAVVAAGAGEKRLAKEVDP